MPIFEYECTHCGRRTEYLQLSSSAPLEACPECNGEVRKLMSAPAFQFKGSGWYVTDYGGKGKDPKGSDGNGAKEASAASTEGGEAKQPKSAKDSGDAKAGATKTTSTKTTSPSD